MNAANGVASFLDPVCSMQVEEDSPHRLAHAGREYRFCSAGGAGSQERGSAVKLNAKSVALAQGVLARKVTTLGALCLFVLVTGSEVSAEHKPQIPPTPTAADTSGGAVVQWAYDS